MKFYETESYLIIIFYTDFETRIRNVNKKDLENFIEKLNNEDTVHDYVITRKIEYDYN